MIYIVSGLIFITVLLFVSSILFSVFYKERAIGQLKYYQDSYKHEIKAEALNMTNKKSKSSIIKTLSKFVPKSKLNDKGREKLELDLVKAGIQLKAEEIFIIRILSATIAGAIVLLLGFGYIISGVTVVVVAMVPNFIIKSKIKKRKKAFDEQINEGIMIISNSLKAGHSFLQAISVVVNETKDPFASEFKKLLKEMSLGITMNESLRNMQDRIDSEDLQLIVNAILIQKDIGGNLSEILDNISGMIRERQKIANEVKTLTAQGKLSGNIVAFLPVLLGTAIYFVNRDYMMRLFTSEIGLMLVGGAVVSQVIGMMVINKIVKIEL